MSAYNENSEFRISGPVGNTNDKPMYYYTASTGLGTMTPQEAKEKKYTNLASSPDEAYLRFYKNSLDRNLIKQRNAAELLKKVINETKELNAKFGYLKNKYPEEFLWATR